MPRQLEQGPERQPQLPARRPEGLPANLEDLSREQLLQWIAQQRRAETQRPASGRAPIRDLRTAQEDIDRELGRAPEVGPRPIIEVAPPVRSLDEEEQKQYEEQLRRKMEQWERLNEDYEEGLKREKEREERKSQVAQWIEEINEQNREGAGAVLGTHAEVVKSLSWRFSGPRRRQWWFLSEKDLRKKTIERVGLEGEASTPFAKVAKATAGTVEFLKGSDPFKMVLEAGGGGLANKAQAEDALALAVLLKGRSRDEQFQATLEQFLRDEERMVDVSDKLARSNPGPRINEVQRERADQYPVVIETQSDRLAKAKLIEDLEKSVQTLKQQRERLGEVKRQEIESAVGILEDVLDKDGPLTSDEQEITRKFSQVLRHEKLGNDVRKLQARIQAIERRLKQEVSLPADQQGILRTSLGKELAEMTRKVKDFPADEQEQALVVIGTSETARALDILHRAQEEGKGSLSLSDEERETLTRGARNVLVNIGEALAEDPDNVSLQRRIIGLSKTIAVLREHAPEQDLILTKVFTAGEQARLAFELDQHLGNETARYLDAKKRRSEMVDRMVKELRKRAKEGVTGEAYQFLVDELAKSGLEGQVAGEILSAVVEQMPEEIKDVAGGLNEVVSAVQGLILGGGLRKGKEGWRLQRKRLPIGRYKETTPEEGLGIQVPEILDDDTRNFIATQTLDKQTRQALAQVLNAIGGGLRIGGLLPKPAILEELKSSPAWNEIKYAFLAEFLPQQVKIEGAPQIVPDLLSQQILKAIAALGVIETEAADKEREIDLLLAGCNPEALKALYEEALGDQLGNMKSPAYNESIIAMVLGAVQASQLPEQAVTQEARRAVEIKRACIRELLAKGAVLVGGDFDETGQVACETLAALGKLSPPKEIAKMLKALNIQIERERNNDYRVIVEDPFMNALKSMLDRVMEDKTITNEEQDAVAAEVCYMVYSLANQIEPSMDYYSAEHGISGERSTLAKITDLVVSLASNYPCLFGKERRGFIEVELTRGTEVELGTTGNGHEIGNLESLIARRDGMFQPVARYFRIPGIGNGLPLSRQEAVLYTHLHLFLQQLEASVVQSSLVAMGKRETERGKEILEHAEREEALIEEKIRAAEMEAIVEDLNKDFQTAVGEHRVAKAEIIETYKWLVNALRRVGLPGGIVFRGKDEFGQPEEHPVKLVVKSPDTRKFGIAISPKAYASIVQQLHPDPRVAEPMTVKEARTKGFLARRTGERALRR